MGGAKDFELEYWEWQVEQEELAFLAGYEEAQSRLRAQCLCRDIEGKDLWMAIVSLAITVLAVK